TKLFQDNGNEPPPRIPRGTTGAAAVGTITQTASPTDITQQSPLPGAQLDVRTLTVAERLRPPPAQDALFYSVGNRVAMLQLLADLEITIDDLEIPADVPGDTTKPVMADLRSNDDTRKNRVFTLIQPQITPPPNSTADEAALFATGVRV